MDGSWPQIKPRVCVMGLKESPSSNRRQLGRMSAGMAPRRSRLKSQFCHRCCGWPQAGNFRPDPYAAGRIWELDEAVGGCWVDKGSTAAFCHPGTKSSPWQSAWLPGDKATALPSLTPSLMPASFKAPRAALCIRERAGPETTSRSRSHPGDPMFSGLALFVYLSKGLGQSDLLRCLF